MEVRSQHFAEAAGEALRAPELQRALAASTDRLARLREAAFSDFPEGDALRDRAQAIKRQTLLGLDRYLDEFATRAEANGCVVHWAPAAADANEIVCRLAAERGARLVAKSKSMTTEEIGLNDALESQGVRSVETDLGEYIIQLANEAPSHIIIPAIHRNVGQIADLFHEKHGTPRSEQHEQLTREARSRLRAVFLEADLGITGANFAIAQTGSIAIVENEGNVRLTTALPRCHIAVVGMEKVIPDLASLGVFLRILARSATGQKMSSYVSLITGPRREWEEDGPEELHIVILDNGRSRLLADPVLREALACIRCGACLNVCPVYRHAGGHAYGWVYPGPIGAVINPTLLGPERAGALPFASSLCGACREVCPVRIDLPKLLLHQRANVTSRAPQSGARLERLLVRLFARAMASPGLYALAARAARHAARPFARRGWIRRAPGLGGWTAARDFPAPARESFRERWARRG